MSGKDLLQVLAKTYIHMIISSNILHDSLLTTCTKRSSWSGPSPPLFIP